VDHRRSSSRSLRPGDAWGCGRPAAVDARGADLARTGVHPKVGELTVRGLIHEWLHHDADHVGQLARIIAGRAWQHMGNRAS